MDEKKLMELGVRAVACSQWEWRGGMQYFDEKLRSWVRFEVRPDEYTPRPPSGSIPSFEDDATLGCLLALVREAWGHTQGQEVYVYFSINECRVLQRNEPGASPFSRLDNIRSRGPTEVEAMVNALCDAAFFADRTLGSPLTS